MRNYRLILAGFAAVCFLSSALFIYRDKPRSQIANLNMASMRSLQPLNVLRINVLNGNEFDFVLTDSRRIHGFLTVSTAPEAKKKVLELLGTCSNPQIVLHKSKENNSWVVAFTVVVKENGQKVDVSDWLKKNHLTYD